MTMNFRLKLGKLSRHHIAPLILAFVRQEADLNLQMVALIEQSFESRIFWGRLSVHASFMLFSEAACHNLGERLIRCARPKDGELAHSGCRRGSPLEEQPAFA